MRVIPLDKWDYAIVVFSTFTLIVLILEFLGAFGRVGEILALFGLTLTILIGLIGTRGTIKGVSEMVRIEHQKTREAISGRLQRIEDLLKEMLDLMRRSRS